MSFKKFMEQTFWNIYLHLYIICQYYIIVEKLEGMEYQVGYPEGWPLLAKYGTLTLSEDSFYEVRHLNIIYIYMYIYDKYVYIWHLYIIRGFNL